MLGFESFFRAEYFNLGAPFLPIFPPIEKSQKTITNFFHRLQKIENKIKMQKLLNQTLATMAKSVRTQFEALWKRNQRVLLLKRLMLCSASHQKTTILLFQVLSHFFEMKILIWVRPSSPTSPQLRKVKKQLQNVFIAFKKSKTKSKCKNYLIKH
jgi:hypothetical protein